jgi:hypothetical protein
MYSDNRDDAIYRVQSEYGSQWDYGIISLQK